MATFIITMNWTEQGIRAVKDWPKRGTVAREMAKKVGVDVKQVFLTMGDADLLAVVEAPDGGHVAKFCMALGAAGNVRTRSARAWSEAEAVKLIGELP
jgi:uncharacterized protein with GYD domain